MDADVDRLQRESNAMIALLKQLEKEEKELTIQNRILSREALLNGFSVEGILESLPKKEPTKKGKTAGTSMKSE
jgi:hypothetical protein